MPPPPERQSQYEPARYWTERLGRNFSLRGVGHGQYSERYNRWIYRRKADVLHQVLPIQAGGRRALDVGSGIGWVVDQLRRAGWGVDGCDISELAVTALQERFPDGRFTMYAFGSGRLPYDDATFDLITMLDVTYHVVDDDLWRQGLRELSRLLTPDGRLVLLDRFGDRIDNAADHVRFRSTEQWEAATAACSLRREVVVPAYRWLSRPPDQGLARLLPDLVRGPVEFALERVSKREPHMRCVRYARG